MGKKYELVKNDTVTTSNGETLYRIRALHDISPGVYEGQLGGYIQSEDNLSHDGGCWVGDSARVSGVAGIVDNARVMGWAEVSGRVQAGDKVRIKGCAQIWGGVRLSGRAEVDGDVQLGGNVVVCGDALITGKTRLFNDAYICSSAGIRENLDIFVFSDILGGDSGSTTMFRANRFCEHERGIMVKNAAFFVSLEGFVIQMDKKCRERGAEAEEICRHFFAFVARYFGVKNPLEHI